MNSYGAPGKPSMPRKSGGRDASPGRRPAEAIALSPGGSPFRAFRSRSPHGRVEVPEDRLADPWIQAHFRPEGWADRWLHDLQLGGVWLAAFAGILLGYALSNVVVGHESALMRAVRQGDAQGLAMVQALLQHGHSPDSLEVQYARVWDTGVPVALITPLYVAAESGSVGIVRELLQHSAEPDKGLHGWNWHEPLLSETPLFAAARGGHLTAMQELIKSGASPNEGRSVLRGVLGATSPLHAIVQKPGAGSTKEVMQVMRLFQREDSRYRGHWGLDSQETLLYAAAKGGHKELVEALLPAASTPLDPAAWRGEGRFLGPAGLFGHISPLYAAATEGHLEMVELLLKRQACADDGVNTPLAQASPLYAAAVNGDHKMTRALLSASSPAMPDVGHSYGVFGLLGHVSPLYAAAAGNSLETVQQLLGYLEQHKRKSISEWRLLKQVPDAPPRASTKHGLWELGLLHLYRTETALFAAARNGNAAMVGALLAEHAAPEEGDHVFSWGYSERTSPLFVAAQQRHAGAVEKLVASSADLNLGHLGSVAPLGLLFPLSHYFTHDLAVEIWSKTPLFAAAQAGSVAATEHILKVQGLARSALPSQGFQILETWHHHPLCAAIQRANATPLPAHPSADGQGVGGGQGLEGGDGGESGGGVSAAAETGNGTAAPEDTGGAQGASGVLKAHTRVAQLLIQNGADFEETQCGWGMYIDVWSAEVLAGLQGDLEMYDAVSKTVINIKHQNIRQKAEGARRAKEEAA